MSVGIWTFALEGKKPAEIRDAALEVEDLGFDTLWFGEAYGREAFTQAAVLLAATTRLRVATGIAQTSWREPAAAAGAERLLDQAYPGRFVHGLGGHRVGKRPVAAIRDYLTALDEALDEPAPTRVIAALGPRMLEVARDHADGAHPYFVPVSHTAFARSVLGPGKFLAVEQAVTFDPALAREHVGLYVKYAPHHQANLRRLGFTDDEQAAAAPRLVDAIVAVGEDAIAARVQAQLDAGADHVCLQVLTGNDDLPLAEWRALKGVVSGIAG
ncbi:probable F420-dependent oxidoreductase, MSMEG_4141 family [Amycolatopsis xylanica]|uniref:Probable F420-dependent oxidoreductase, MSMEG_4141 family n=1 Tax=Amycolatopsis xylanica TaxID=589385 RepID=A0A1H3CWQ7_9PSEU|nr:TIGR03620 family F420-dependent LLM class oxidoreductase [Amycolatopsis xylanica]SDX58581.1 probable F420-dependent oxidoreductase, MSMEG_4141 family [Amycolatopsis xylanica]